MAQPSWFNTGLLNVRVVPDATNPKNGAGRVLTEHETMLFHALMENVARTCRDDDWSRLRAAILTSFLAVEGPEA